jgi:hypothetical protein
MRGAEPSDAAILKRCPGARIPARECPLRAWDGRRRAFSSPVSYELPRWPLRGSWSLAAAAVLSRD